MNKLPLIFVGIFLTFTSAWIGLVAYPTLNLANVEPIPDEETGGVLPPTTSGMAIAGQKVYASAGCMYCHSQQVRWAPLSTDIAKGLGTRQTVARDYIREKVAFLGTMRTGPDLSNIGVRQTDANWHHLHLFEPRTVTEWSIMPSYRYLYKTQKISGQPSNDAIQGLRGPHAPKPGYEVVPSVDAKALVAYMLSLKKNYKLPESPEPTAK